MNKQSSGKAGKKPGELTGFRKALDAIAKDLWIVILDVVAVNAAYLLILLIRAYFIGIGFNTAEYPALKMYLQFAPFYTVLCVIVFALCRLYNGMWRYAGINDMNRIILASVITTAIHVVGIMLIRGESKIPRGYYVGGALFQFVFITIIRFAYRFILVEQKKIASRRMPAVNVMIVGAGETARKAIHQLEDSVYQPACILDSRSTADGKSMDGVPVLGGTGRMEKAAAQYAVSGVILADPTLSVEDRENIRRFCEAKGLELQDFTGILVNLSGRVPLTALLETVTGPVIISADGKTDRFASGMDALRAVNDRYTVTSLGAEDGCVRIELKAASSEAYAGYEAWLQKHEEETGEQVSYF